MYLQSKDLLLRIESGFKSIDIKWTSAGIDKDECVIDVDGVLIFTTVTQYQKVIE